MGKNIFEILIPTKEQVRTATSFEDVANLVRNGINVCKTTRNSEDAICGTSMAVMRLKQFLYDSDVASYQLFAESYKGWKELVEEIDKIFPEDEIGKIVERFN